jgi:hypothetical protein
MSPLLMDLQTVIAQWIVLGVVVCAVGVVLFRSKQKRDPLANARQSLSQQRDVERQMQSMILELSQVIRDFHGELDARVAKLEAANRAADQKIAILRKLSAASDSLPRMPAESPLTTIDAPDALADSPNQAIYQLADKGKSAHEIAAELDRPFGEIELILALRSRA